MNKQHFCFALFPRRSCSRLNLAWSLQQSWGRAFLVSLKVLSLGAVLCLLFVGTGRSLWRKFSRFMQVMSQQETQSCGWLIFCHSVIYSVVIFSCIWLLSLREAEGLAWFKVTHCKAESFTPTLLVPVGWLSSGRKMLLFGFAAAFTKWGTRHLPKAQQGGYAACTIDKWLLTLADIWFCLFSCKSWITAHFSS